jgi:hypothetical protein
MYVNAARRLDPRQMMLGRPRLIVLPGGRRGIGAAAAVGAGGSAISPQQTFLNSLGPPAGTGGDYSVAQQAQLATWNASNVSPAAAAAYVPVGGPAGLTYSGPGSTILDLASIDTPNSAMVITPPAIITPSAVISTPASGGSGSSSGAVNGSTTAGGNSGGTPVALSPSGICVDGADTGDGSPCAMGTTYTVAAPATALPSTIIPGIPDIVVYVGGAALLLVIVVPMLGGRK